MVELGLGESRGYIGHLSVGKWGGLPGFQEAGLALYGVEAVHQRSMPGYGDEERKGNWNMVLKNGHRGGGQSYLGFRMLAWPLVEEEVSSRVLAQDMVPRVGVKLGRHRKSWEDLTWCSGCWPGLCRMGNFHQSCGPGFQGAGLVSNGVEGFCQRYRPRYGLLIPS